MATVLAGHGGEEGDADHEAIIHHREAPIVGGIERYTITVRIHGREYTADVEVVGKLKLRQRVIFRGQVLVDSETYTPARRSIMRLAARQILWHLVARGSLGESPLEPPEPPG